MALGERWEMRPVLGADDNDWKRVGLYDAANKAFQVERFPLPPQVRREVIPNDVRGGWDIVYDIIAACPKCKEDVRFAWKHEVQDYYLQAMANRVQRAEADRMKAEWALRDMQKKVAKMEKAMKKMAAATRKKRRGW